MSDSPTAPTPSKTAADPAAPRTLDELFAACSAMVFHSARRITGGSEDAEDVLQTVFLKFARHHEPLGEAPWPDNPPAWLKRTTVNASLDLLRRRKRRPEDELDDVAVAADAQRDHVGVEERAAARLDSLRLREALREALTHLTPFEAEVFTLHFIEQLGNKEIAEALGKTANNIGVTLHAARKKLRTHLSEAGLAGPRATRPAHGGSSRLPAGGTP